MLNLARLRVLQEVAESGSLSAAADALGYTASAVSQQVATLERELGVAVVNRHARGVTLTEAGEVLLTHGRRLLAAERAARSELEAVARGESGRIRLGWFSTAGAALVPRALAEFLHDRPGVELDLVEADPSEATERLRTGDLDLALIYRFELEADPAPDLDQEVLLEDPIHVGVARDAPLAARGDLRLVDFASEAWIQGVGAGSTLTALPAACRVAGFAPRVVFRTDDHLVVQGLVAAGVGVALLPHIAVPAIRPDITLKRVEGAGLHRQVRVAFATRRRSPPLLRAVSAALRSAARQVAADARARASGGQSGR